MHTRFFPFLASVIAALLLTAPPAYAGKPVPLVDYQTSDSTFLTLDPAAAKLTILHFWATWCRPCIAEMPELDALYGDYKDKGLQVIAISLDGKNVDKVQRFFKDKNITQLTPYFDPRNVAFSMLGLRAMPTTLFIDNAGNVIAAEEGPIEWNRKDIRAFIEKNL